MVQVNTACTQQHESAWFCTREQHTQNSVTQFQWITDSHKVRTSHDGALCEPLELHASSEIYVFEFRNRISWGRFRTARAQRGHSARTVRAQRQLLR